MLENPSTDTTAAAASIETVKRYAPPNQRNRSLGRGKSGGVYFADRLEWANTYVNDGERNPIGVTKTSPVADHGEGVGNNCASENLRMKLIPLLHCCNSEAFHLLNNRWTAAMSAHNSLPENSAERPVLYTRKSAPAWGHSNLPHLLIQPTDRAPTSLQRDFRNELQQAIHNVNSFPNP
ncbi:hypothetical protein Pfo_018422 [Paulownia fortunei]|nr:hypothetical protein Pfo_018422 [Paulownia fortunei]